MRFRRGREDEPAEVEPDALEREILGSLAALRDANVREVMTPRVDVVALAVPVTPEAVARAVRSSGHSRFPVYDGDLDHLVGVLFVKDLYRLTDPVPTDEAIRRRLRSPYVVPEARRVLDVLGEMRARRKAFAVVVDEHGGVEGVLTVKDLVSALVGDLPDEFDVVDDEDVVKVDARRWLLDGACPVDRVADAVGLELPEGEYVTLGGFLFDRFGRIPDVGDEVEHDGWSFRVAEMARRRIAKVVLHAPSASIGPSGK